MQPSFLKETMRFGLSFVRERRTVKQKTAGTRAGGLVIIK